MSERIKVVVTGAAGQIAYSLIPRLVDGKTFGNKKIIPNISKGKTIEGTLIGLFFYSHYFIYIKRIN